MGIVYWFAITIIGIFLWIIISVSAFPLLRLFMQTCFPALWNVWFERPVIKQIKDSGKFVYTHFLMRVLLILWCIAVFVVAVLYFVYFVAKYIFLTQALTASLGKAILENVVIKEFIDFGIFPFFDNILGYFVPNIFKGQQINPINTAILNFGSTFVKKVRSEETKQPDTPKSTSNPNLTTEQNKAVNSKFENCIKVNTVNTYKNKDQFGLIMNTLNTTKTNIMCEIQKIQDSIEVKNIK